MYKVILISALCCVMITLSAQSKERYALDGNNAYKAGVEMLLESQSLSGDSTRQNEAQQLEGKANKAFSEAEVSYKKAIEKDPSKYLEAEFNLGDALYKQGRYEDSRNKFQSIIDEKNTPPEVKGGAYHNIGNSHLQEFFQNPQDNQGKLDESIDSYKEALRQNPYDSEARYNLEYVKKLKEQEQEQEQQEKQEDQKEQEKQDDQKEQEKQDDQKEQEKQDDQKEQEKDEISKEDAERLLEALENKEEELQEERKDKKAKAGRFIIEKDW
jgi:tetratricopeptide (TPR) repeat protein